MSKVIAIDASGSMSYRNLNDAWTKAQELADADTRFLAFNQAYFFVTTIKELFKVAGGGTLIENSAPILESFNEVVIIGDGRFTPAGDDLLKKHPDWEIVNPEVVEKGWWTDGNDLALVEAMCKFAREQDGGFSGQHHATLNSHLVGAARVIGMNEDDIRAAFDSDRGLVIYEP